MLGCAKPIDSRRDASSDGVAGVQHVGELGVDGAGHAADAAVGRDVGDYYGVPPIRWLARRGGQVLAFRRNGLVRRTTQRSPAA